MQKTFPVKFPVTEQTHLQILHESCIRCEGRTENKSCHFH